MIKKFPTGAGTGDLLKELLGRRVQVWTLETNCDDGVLEAFDLAWVRLRKETGETFYFQRSAIRLIKMLERLPRDRHVTPAPHGGAPPE